MKLRISDIVVRTREVVLPERCPNCGLALVFDSEGTTESEIPLDTVIPVRLEWNFTSDVVLPVQVDDSGESLPPAGYTCDCGHLLAWGRCATVESPSPEVEQDCVWSRALTRVIFSKSGR